MKSTSDFSAWINSLDRSIRIRVDQRIQRLAHGILGGHKDTQSNDIRLAKELLEGVKSGQIRVEKYE